jgi:hypothetical protein
MKRKLLLLAMLFCCLLLSACHTKEPASPPIGGTSETKTSAQTIVSNTTVPKTTPPSTPLETTPPETSPPETIPLPLTEASVREAFAKFRPDYTLKEVVETEAGYFLFSKLNHPNYAPQLSCERAIDFLDKNTGSFAKIKYNFEEIYREYSKTNVLGYALIDEQSMYLYPHSEIFYDSGHWGFPSVTRLSYENGVLLFDFGKETVRIFYPLTEDGFYNGFNEFREGFIALSAAFSSNGGLSLLFDATDPQKVADFIIMPRVNFSYDAKNHQMTLTCPNVLVDENLLGNIPVSSADPYIKAAKLEKYEDGIRVTLQLKPEAELYIPWGHSFDRVRHAQNAPGVMFEIEFASREAVEEFNYHIFDKIVFICNEP